jgi:hypothetical protein
LFPLHPIQKPGLSPQYPLRLRWISHPPRWFLLLPLLSPLPVLLPLLPHLPRPLLRLPHQVRPDHP